MNADPAEIHIAPIIIIVFFYINFIIYLKTYHVTINIIRFLTLIVPELSDLFESLNPHSNSNSVLDITASCRNIVCISDIDLKFNWQDDHKLLGL